MTRRISMFGYQVDALRMSEAVDELLRWTADEGSVCRYVVTPNTDHTVMFQEHAGLRAAYADASMVLADGMPVVLASRLLGKPLPERVTGADIVQQLFATVARSKDLQSKPLHVFLLGAAPGVAERAARNIELRWPGVKVSGVYSPPLGFEKNADENRRILERIADAEADVLVVGLGAPKQELWVHAHHHQIKARVAFCVGATIDFLAGEKRRAPRWMQRTGLEWLHRMLSEPRRLVKRYARDAWVFPRLLWREWRSAGSSTT